MSGMLKVFDGSVWQNIGLVDPSSGSGGGLSYKVYSALLAQTGTDDPVATVLENTIGTITWSRGGAGFYEATCTDCFTLNKTMVFISPDRYFQDGNENDINIIHYSDDVIGFEFTSGNDISYDIISPYFDVNGNYYLQIEIRVYP